VCQKDQQKSTGTKAVHRILMKLIPGVNFIKTLQVAFAQKLFCQKNHKAQL